MDFHDAETLAGIFREAGFEDVRYRKFMMGTIGIHWGTRP
jgi:demethylmenaquinone methyltransferase/2-methoxy-6-polyprenyl-1,4-benzoquinol methylase